MMQIGLIGICAGAAAALLFASVVSGSLLSILLFYLSPLPIMIAALGWGHWSGLVAALTGALALASIFGGTFFFAFLGSAGVPAWWLGYLAMLARPAAAGAGNGHAPNSAAPALEWFPAGRLVLWAAALAAMVVIVTIPNFGTDAESFRAGLQSALSQLLRTSGDVSLPSPADDNRGRLFEFLVMAIPPAAAVIATVTNTVNLWLSARIVKFSGRLTRPWPSLADMSFPRLASAALAVAVLMSFLGGLIGIFACIVSASLLMAYGFLGFAVLHAVTRGTRSRAFLLGSTYAAVLVFGWPVLMLCVLGLAEAAFDLRTRFAQRRGPPAPT